ncbi:MAG TPA: histidine phosphatase family protein, partial [Thermoflexales bacterium]|nr:histidine phosphatase family protein [Thermoflexales bacterium]
MQLYFIRHAQSANNLLFDLTGSWSNRVEDPELTELGVKQAERVAAHLAETREIEPVQKWDPHNVRGFFITHLYVSPQVRASHTGDLVGKALNIKPVLWDEIHECGGIYLENEDGLPQGKPGQNRAFFEGRFPSFQLPHTLGDGGWWDGRPPEERAECRARAQRVWQTLIARHGHTRDRVALVSHGDFWGRLAFVMLGMDPDKDAWLGMGNTAIARVDYMEHDEEVVLVYMNRL